MKETCKSPGRGPKYENSERWKAASRTKFAFGFLLVERLEMKSDIEKAVTTAFVLGQDPTRGRMSSDVG